MLGIGIEGKLYEISNKLTRIAEGIDDMFCLEKEAFQREIKNEKVSLDAKIEIVQKDLDILLNEKKRRAEKDKL